MMNDSVKLAELWTNLKAVKDKIDNQIIPVGGHLGVEDPELMIALEDLSANIQNHFEQFKLNVVKANKQ
jgi:hypothetical protein